MASDSELDPLTRLAIRHGTDKWAPHFYTPIYHAHFSSLRERPVRLLEIGVGGYESAQLGGNSLRMWADYFPHGTVVGIDIAEKRLAPIPRVIVLRGSQDDPAFLESLCATHGPFDIIIDDGSHMPKQVAASFGMLFPKLSDGGIYVIEDVQTAFWPGFGGSPEDGAETMQLAHSILRGINHMEIAVAAPSFEPPPHAASIRALHAYHNLLVIEKGNNREPSNERYELSDPHVAAVVTAIERELAHAPSADASANLAFNYMLGRDYTKALMTVRRGLDRWPNHFFLLAVGVVVAGHAEERKIQDEFVRRLVALAPDDPLVRKMSGQSG